MRLGPGVNLITLRVGKVCGVRLSLTYGSSAFRSPCSGEIELRDAGSERVTRRRRAGAQAEVYVPGPGRYPLTPPIPGFASVPPFELNVPAESWSNTL
ncbi:MAG: hypothetical protein U1E76_15435 [Planctomycetota bacterium]